MLSYQKYNTLCMLPEKYWYFRVLFSIYIFAFSVVPCGYLFDSFLQLNKGVQILAFIEINLVLSETSALLLTTIQERPGKLSKLPRLYSNTSTRIIHNLNNPYKQATDQWRVQKFFHQLYSLSSCALFREYPDQTHLSHTPSSLNQP